MPTAAVIRDFARSCEHLPEIEPDVIETLVDFKESYFDDPDPTLWRADVLRELMLGVLPRKVTAPDDWFATVTPSVKAYLTFLSSHRRLASGSDRAEVLLAELDQIGDGVVAAAQDPRNFGMAKAILSAVGLDPSAPDPAAGVMETFNALPDEQRASILDPARRGLGPGDVLALSPALSPFDDGPFDDGPFDDGPFDDGPFDDGPFDDDDDFDDFDETWPSLPLIWLPPATELAAAVRSAPLVGSLLRLADWNGAGQRVTRQAVLPLSAARRACADLSLPLPAAAVRSAQRIPALHRLWFLATQQDILVVNAGSAVRGGAADLLTDPGSAPEAVLDWWINLFICCLDWGLDVSEDPDTDEDLEDDILDAVDDIVETTLTELYPGIRVPASDLEEAVTTMVEEPWAGYADICGLSPQEIREQVRQRWTAHLAQLIDVGATTVDDGMLSLTPLGRAGVRALALTHGSDAPLADDPAALDVETLLEALPFLGEAVAEPLITAWSTGRTPEQATNELLDVARASTARTRMSAVAVLAETFRDHVAGAGRPHLETLQDDPVLGLYAHILLTGPGQPPELPPHLRQWAALEAVAVAVDSGALDDKDTAAKVWEIVDEDGGLDSAWRSTHPQLTEILEAVAAHHPRGRTRKAAKKALFKNRQRNTGH